MRASHVARSAAIGLGAGVCLFVGLIFWTIAAWLFLVTVTTVQITALIIGSVYCGAGLIGFALIGSRKPHDPRANAVPDPAPRPADVDGLMGAFVTGMNAGVQARSARR